MMTVQFLRAAFLAMLAVALPSGASAQRVATAVAPDTVYVGDVVRAAVRVELPPGHRAIFPDSLPLAGDVEAAGRVESWTDTLQDGTERLTMSYPVSAWRPGAVALPAVPIRIVGPEGETSLEARLPGFVVRSILPADAEKIEPRGLKDVLGANRTWWPLLLALLVGSVAAAGGVWYWRTRRGAKPLPVVPPIPPRERALAELDRARTMGLLEAGEFKAFYSIVTGAVRGFLESVEPDLGAEWTTTELLEKADRRLDSDSLERLGQLLRAADLVKFARREPRREDALGDWELARTWVLAFGHTTDLDVDSGEGEAAV